MNDSIYDKNGRLIYGTIPTQFPEETILTSNTPRMITGSNRKWMIYDSVAIIIEKLTHQKIPFHKARILSDVVVVIIGIIFATASGAGIWSVVGIGTIINACFNGPLIQFFKTKLERFYL